SLQATAFPRSGYIPSRGIIAVVSLIVSLVVLEPYLSLKPLLLVTGYGFRSNFVHLPLIFVMGKTFEPEDVKKLGWWVLLCLIPMAALLAVQFHASPVAFITRTAALVAAPQIPAV